MAEFEYMEHTWDFHYKVGDFVDSYYSVPIDGEVTPMDKESYCMLKITEVDEVDEVKEICIVKGPNGVVERNEDGTIKCPKLSIHGYGYVVLATDSGISKIKTLIPEHKKESVQFIMGSRIARPI